MTMTEAVRLVQMCAPKPHDDYFDALEAALDEAGFAETPRDMPPGVDESGKWNRLSMWFDLTPASGLCIDFTDHPHGLRLWWSWNSGYDPDLPERGAAWEWAPLDASGGQGELGFLPVDGYAEPGKVVAAALDVIAAGCTGDIRAGEWEHAAELAGDAVRWSAVNSDGRHRLRAPYSAYVPRLGREVEHCGECHRTDEDGAHDLQGR